MSVNVCMCTYLDTNAHTGAHTHASTEAHTHAHTRTSTLTRTRTHMYARTHGLQIIKVCIIIMLYNKYCGVHSKLPW